MLRGAMVSVPRPVRFLFVVLAVPLLAGCTALGLPRVPGVPLVPVAQELLDASPIPGTSPDAATLGTVASIDGYSLAIPSGWSATDLSMEDGLALTDLLAGIEPALAAVGRQGLEAEGSPHLSLAVVDAAAIETGGYGPAVVVATMRTRGMDKAAARTLVEGLLGQTALASDVVHSVQGLPAGNAHRYDAMLFSDSGIMLQVQVNVFRAGRVSFIVAAMAPADRFALAQPAFDAILKSLRFGV